MVWVASLFHPAFPRRVWLMVFLLVGSRGLGPQVAGWMERSGLSMPPFPSFESYRVTGTTLCPVRIGIHVVRSWDVAS